MKYSSDVCTHLFFHQFYMISSGYFPGQYNPSKKGSVLKGKNLLLEEQIPSLKSWPPIEKRCKNVPEFLALWGTSSV